LRLNLFRLRRAASKKRSNVSGRRRHLTSDALGNLLAAAVQQVAAAPLMGFLPPAGLERLPSETGN
jgi:hypothetical protein